MPPATAPGADGDRSLCSEGAGREVLTHGPRLVGGCVTASGAGALSVFRVSGEAVLDLLMKIFRPAQGGRTDPRRRLVFGHLMDGEDVVDEALVMMPGPGRSAEISTHGGRGMQAAVESLLARSGVTLVGGEKLFEALPGVARSGVINGEARRGLKEARTVQAMLFYAAALHGALEREVAVLTEDLGSAPGSGSSIPLLRQRLQTLLARSAFGVAFSQPPTVLIAGPPNAGKSTLANRLSGHERCIVTDEAGTTRDLVGEDISLQGFPFHLVDSAGLHRGDDPLERAGMERARDAARHASLLLVVVDGNRADSLDEIPEEWLRSRRSLIVLNKQDLGLAHPVSAVAARSGRPCLGVSAARGEGLEALAGHLVFRSPFRGPATRDLPCPFTQRQVEGLQEAFHHLEEDSRRAARALGVLLGEMT